jgi:hypothetical protein
MLELQNLLKMKHMCAELRNLLGNVVLRKILGTFVFGNITSTPPPPPFAFRKNSFEGALEWKGAQILEYTPPPQPETGWHGPA